MTFDPKTRPFCEPSFWEKRLREAIAKDKITDAVFVTDADSWKRFEEHHRQVLLKYVSPSDSILDIACGWGRLITLLPRSWYGKYYGMDIAPCFIARAKALHPTKVFHVFDLRKLPEARPVDSPRFNWGIGISIQRGLIGHLGQEVWDDIERRLLIHCERLLLLDFDTETAIVREQ